MSDPPLSPSYVGPSLPGFARFGMCVDEPGGGTMRGGMSPEGFIARFGHDSRMAGQLPAPEIHAKSTAVPRGDAGSRIAGSIWMGIGVYLATRPGIVAAPRGWLSVPEKFAVAAFFITVGVLGLAGLVGFGDMQGREAGGSRARWVSAIVIAALVALAVYWTTA